MLCEPLSALRQVAVKRVERGTMCAVLLPIDQLKSRPAAEVKKQNNDIVTLVVKNLIDNHGAATAFRSQTT
jgi:hypothetical protein